MVGGRSYLFQPPRRAVGPSGINPGFPGLSQCQGWVTHVLLTRSPLSPGPKARFSLDLHVLSAPPAFVLSQDQTLREEWVADRSRRYLHFELLAQRPPNPREAGGRRGVDVLIQPKPDQVSTLEERSLLSFQRPAPLRRRKKASDSRQRPTEQSNRIGYE